MSVFEGLTREEAINCLTWTFVAFIYFIIIVALVVGCVIGLYFCFRLSKRNKLDMAYIRLKGRVWFRAMRKYRKQVQLINEEQILDRGMNWREKCLEERVNQNAEK
jgi:hypothetical protein